MIGLFGGPPCPLVQLLFYPMAPGGVAPQSAPGTQTERQQIAATLWRIRRLYQQAAGDDGKELADVGRQLLTAGESTSRTLILLGQIVESLVQEASIVYGTAPGSGPLKADRVRAAAVQLFITANIEIPGIPPYLLPWVFEVVTDISVEFLVRLLNLHDLWDADDASGLKIKNRLFGFLSRVPAWLAQLLTRISRALVLWQNRIDAPTAALVAHVAPELDRDFESSLKDLESLAQAIVAHRTQVLALVEVIAIAVQQAEAFLEKSGPEKKEYASELIAEFLAEMGFPIPEFLIDVMIEVVVAIFNRHEVLSPHAAS